MENNLPHNTLIRLSKYRRLLEKYKYMDEPYIFSHDLARMLDIKAVNIRHDLMLLGLTGDRQKGYSINLLLEKITSIIDRPGRGVILFGMGRLGKSLISYLKNSESKLQIVAAIDIAPAKIGTSWEGVDCRSIADLGSIMDSQASPIAMLAIPSEEVSILLPFIVDAGIKGILNYTPEHLAVPEDVFVKNMDMVSALEEISYFME